MGVLDFLFEGRPPKSVTTYGQTIQNVPTWMSDYTQGLIARANAVSAEPYNPYSGPRIADFSPTQEAAFDRTVGNVGAFDQPLNDAITNTYNIPGQGALTQAQQYLTDASGRLPDNVTDYMDPYTQNVIDRSTQIANRNFQDKIMPGLESRFIGSGQNATGPASSAHFREANRASRDLTEGVQAQSLAALSDAYRTAGTQFQADQTRLGALGQASTQLGATQADVGLKQAEQLGALGQAGQAMGLRDAASLEAVGQQEQGMTQRNLDLAYQDFLQQRDYPRNQVDWMSQVIRGMPASAVPTATTTSSTGPSSVYQPSPLAQIAALASGVKGISTLGD